MSDLLNVDIAIERILEHMHTTDSVLCHLRDALGRILAQDVVADINLPPFANSSMDGYALRAADSERASADAPVPLRVVLDIAAGQAPTQVLQPGQAARIMTGAPMPEGADAVVPVEATDSPFDRNDPTALPDAVRVFAPLQAGANVRVVGENVAQGQLVLSAGVELRAAEMGMLAALGIGEVRVLRQPRVVILSSGDELVGVDDPLTPGKIRDVNSYTLAALVQTYGGEAFALPPARDTLDDLRRLYDEALALKPDFIISSAGVSVGAADLVRQVMGEYGDIGFWRINLRPGKPLAFGDLRGVPFFGLPGNPVSAMVTFEVLVLPALLKCAGRTDTSRYIQATVGETMHSDGRRSYNRVRLQREGATWMAYSTGTQSSGALMSLVVADGLLIIPEGVKQVEAGRQLTVKLLRHMANL